jgi:hypothetical protein
VTEVTEATVPRWHLLAKIFARVSELAGNGFYGAEAAALGPLRPERLAAL